MRLIDDNGECHFLDNRWLWPRKAGAAIRALMRTRSWAADDLAIEHRPRGRPKNNGATRRVIFDGCQSFGGRKSVRYSHGRYGSTPTPPWGSVAAEVGRSLHLNNNTGLPAP